MFFILLISCLTVVHGEPLPFLDGGSIGTGLKVLTTGQILDTVDKLVDGGTSLDTLVKTNLDRSLQLPLEILKNLNDTLSAILSGNCTKKGTGKTFDCYIGEDCLSSVNTCTKEPCADPDVCMRSETSFTGCKAAADCSNGEKSYMCCTIDACLATEDLCSTLPYSVDTALGGRR
ncbi:hypothetical protein NDU88_001260 [Pleurodeles waltl]|uniref:Uncharacterized protein n=1 Tax=Pleurodeles waltl TaxID=8319 RepID=A0AAV7U7Z6_PLEWA|nr:hypothetical protein NDU88_001260 [Pleurodeles waltl]